MLVLKSFLKKKTVFCNSYKLSMRKQLESASETTSPEAQSGQNCSDEEERGRKRWMYELDYY